LGAGQARAQNDVLPSFDIDSAHTSPKNRPSYFVSGIGVGSGILRDKATSPLYYRGATLLFSLGSQRTDTKVDRLFSANMSLGEFISEQNGTASSSSFIGLDMYYQKLYRLTRFSAGKWNTKIGGALVSTLNIRINPSFMNNALGLESVNNLMLAGKTTFDISRNRAKKFKLWFIKGDLKPKKMHLSAQLNIGLLNLNYRPSYAYNYSPSMEGTEMQNIFGHYSVGLRGFRVQSRIDYTHYIKNGNAYRFSYLWDAYRARNKFEPLDLATHTLAFYFLFRTN
jgi:hypothetical protein